MQIIRSFHFCLDLPKLHTISFPGCSTNEEVDDGYSSTMIMRRMSYYERCLIFIDLPSLTLIDASEENDWMKRRKAHVIMESILALLMRVISIDIPKLQEGNSHIPNGLLGNTSTSHSRSILYIVHFML